MNYGPLPRGHYQFVVEEIGSRHTMQSGHRAFSVLLRIVGTDRQLWKYFTTGRPDDWTGLVSEFTNEGMKELLGRQFIAEVRNVTFHRQERNIIRDFECEVLS